MTSYLSKLSPVPAFPAYTGPYKVGTIDVEIPVSELDSPSPSPDESISTIQYRIFYPCDPESKGKNVNWIPAPQRDYLSAYTRFLGAGSIVAEIISFFPRLLHYITIPVRKNAALLQPTTSNSRWPVMLFSHGLGGTRNAYSQLVGSIAAHGIIVICPEHRDGSTPISFIRSVPSENASGNEKSFFRRNQKTVDYKRYSHTPSPEVEEGRNAQLKTRLWELGLVHDSLLKLDEGVQLTNLNTSAPLECLKGKMDVHTPGKIIMAGHSFGAATITQFVKTVFYSFMTFEAPESYTPLFSPSSRSPILFQITPQTPVILLDVWCLPLRASTTRWLWDLPFPCYSTSAETPSDAGLLAIESQAFFKWRIHLKATKRLLSASPSKPTPTQQPSQINPPHFYYAETSAHLSQSDFGILFPWFTRRFLAITEPERILRLNIRAITQLLRNSKIEVGNTSHADMEMEDVNAVATSNDTKIFGGEIRGWKFISTDLSDMADVDDDNVSEEKGEVENTVKANPLDAVVGNELNKEVEGTLETLSDPPAGIA